MSSFFRADLHCHTTCSDGTSTPEEIIDLACASDLQGLSITDHDTFAAYERALPYAKLKNLELVSGIEFSAAHKNTNVHILAYSFSLNSLDIHEFCQKHLKRRLNRNKLMIAKLANANMILNESDFELASDRPMGRPHIALAMLKKGYVHSIQEAFQKYIGEDKPFYVNGENFSLEETLEVIHKAQGLAVIAHPHLIQDTSILPDLLRMNFDGIEGYYGRFAKKDHERWVKIGARKGWLITGGSDFHGQVKPNSSLGSSWVNEETFEILKTHFKKASESSL